MVLEKKQITYIYREFCDITVLIAHDKQHLISNTIFLNLGSSMILNVKYHWRTIRSQFCAKRNLLIILQTGSYYNYQIFICNVFGWIQAPWIINFFNPKGNQKAIWNPSLSVFFFIFYVRFGFPEKATKFQKSLSYFWVSCSVRATAYLSKSQFF